MIITREIHVFRETIRHLWNTYMRVGADWDTVDVFRDISRLLFEEGVVARLGLEAPPIPVDIKGHYLSQYRIFMEGKGKLPLHVNRDVPARGYWDYPLDWIPAESDYEIRPICFF